MGFRKAKAEQAFLKISEYGPPGSGKSFTALLIAEGLANVTGKRIAYIDTEHGTDFYAQAVPSRKVHPEAFDFDAIYTRSMMEILREVRNLDLSVYGVVVLDSVTHIWEAAIASYSGRKGPGGQIPMHAWGAIKRPYKDLMKFLIDAPVHAFILGRQGAEFAENDEGETKAVGYKMKAEGETQYEPHICIRMESQRVGKKGDTINAAIVEKDRTGTLQGRVIVEPNFESIAKPILPLLGIKQAHTPDSEEAAQQDADALANAGAEKAKDSANLLRTMTASLLAAATETDVAAAGKAITPAIKARMLSRDVDTLRATFAQEMARAKGAVPVGVNGEETTNAE